MSNLYTASQQWSTRPNDERFWNLADLYAATRHYRETAREAVSQLSSLRAEPGDGGQLALVGPTGNPAVMSNWAFGQVARTVGAPADYLRGLPGDLAATNINHGLVRLTEKTGNLLIHQNGGLVLRSLTSESYSRIWDCDVVSRLQDFQQYGWKVPPARPCRSDMPGARLATAEDCLQVGGGGGLSVKVGDLIAPAGLYASDHDCFVFMVNEQNRISDGTDGGLSRGFFVSNSEVGAAALKVTMFLYRHVCGNHIVWGAKDVSELRVIHRGEANERFQRELYGELRRYADASASEDETRIAQAQRFSLGTDKETVLDALFAKLRGDIPRKTIEVGYDRACLESNSDTTIDPNTAWGMAQGLTAYSQEVLYQDERNKIDRAAGKVLQMAF